MEAIIVYNDLKDRELVKLIDTNIPIFVDYIDVLKDKNRAYKIKSHWGAIANPFVELREGDKTIKVFYSEKYNAIHQLIEYLNGCKN